MLDIQIEEMIEKYKSTVYSVALTHTKTRFDADDVFQDVFLAYYRKQPCFKDFEHAKAWFIRTTVNICKKQYNSSLWKRAVSMDEVKEEQFSFTDPRENELFDHLRKIPPKLRTVIYLYYFEEMSTKKISKLLHRREGTVRMQLTRARDKLREIIGGRK